MDILRGIKVWTVIVCILSQTGPTYGQTFGSGYVKYQKGDFVSAESTFTQALKTAQNPGEKAKILKYLGISQFMLNNPTAAKTSFKEAISLVPSLKIDANEVLDEGVLELFNEVKSASPSSDSQSQNPKDPNSQAPGRPERPVKKTMLKVISTPSDSQVAIDGILAGRGGEWIDTNPGTVPVTISASGYDSKELIVTITANRENIVKISLEKTKPKVIPKPTVKSSPKSTPKSTARSQDGQPTPQNPGMAASRARTRVGRSANKPPASSPESRAPTPAPAPAPAGPDLATQFAMDAAAASQPTPSPYGGYGAPGYGAPVYSAPGYYPNYGYGSGWSTRYRYRQEDPDYLILAFPFGTGQFHQDRYIAGLFFLVTEGYGVYYAVTGYRAMQVSKTRQDSYRKANCTDQNITEEKAAECNQITETQEKFRASTQSSITAASVAVFALILYGAADAIVKDPDFQLPAPPKRSRRTGETPSPEDIKTAFSEHALPSSSWHWHLALSPRPAYDGEERAGYSRLILRDHPAPDSRQIPGILWNLEWKF